MKRGPSQEILDPQCKLKRQKKAELYQPNTLYESYENQAQFEQQIDSFFRFVDEVNQTKPWYDLSGKYIQQKMGYFKRIGIFTNGSSFNLETLYKSAVNSKNIMVLWHLLEYPLAKEMMVDAFYSLPFSFAYKLGFYPIQSKDCLCHVAKQMGQLDMAEKVLEYSGVYDLFGICALVKWQQSRLPRDVIKGISTYMPLANRALQEHEPKIDRIVSASRKTNPGKR